MFGKLCRALKRQRGFSLVELMIVLIILAILVGIAVPLYKNSQKDAEKKACFANQRMIDSAVQQYLVAHPNKEDDLGDSAGKTVDSNHKLVTDKYLKAAPKCPEADDYYKLKLSNGTLSIERPSGCTHGAYQ